MKNYLTEFIGTFFLVLVIGLVAGAGRSIGYLGPMAVGMTLMVMIYMGAHVSGAHYNPAITLAVYIRGKISLQEGGLYILAQLIAAFAAIALAGILIQDDAFQFGKWMSPGANATYLQAILTETLFTFALAFVYLNVYTTKYTRGNSFFGLAVGGTLVAALYAGEGISGGAFHPFVGLAPNVITLEFSDWWIYLVGPLLGGTIAGFVFKLQHPKG